MLARRRLPRRLSSEQANASTPMNATLPENSGCIEDNSVLPPVISERDISPFKFWFNENIQDGMCYHSELYYRRYTASIRHRAKIYHYACKLANRTSIIVTTTSRQCSIWVSLRREKPNPQVGDRPLPSFQAFLSVGQSKPTLESPKTE